MALLYKTRNVVVILGVLLLFVSGCVYGRGLTYAGEGALLGAMYGAGIGAAIGSTHGHAGEGAGIGSLVGSVIGGAIGYGLDAPLRYGYADPYHDPNYNPYYNPYSGNPNHPGNGQPPADEPYYKDDPDYDPGDYEPMPYREDTFDSTDAPQPAYTEEETPAPNRRVMSPGYDAR